MIADVFTASQRETHDGESGRRMGHSGAFSGEARPLSGEGPQPRGHAATRSRHQARQLLAHSRQVSQPAVGAEPLTSVASLSAHSAYNHAPTTGPSGPTWREAALARLAHVRIDMSRYTGAPLSHPPRHVLIDVPLAYMSSNPVKRRVAARVTVRTAIRIIARFFTHDTFLLSNYVR